MTARHLVVGAGPVGTAVASLLAGRDIPVRLVSRRGLGPDHPLVERVPADAADTDRLRTLAAGSAVIYNCLNPPYHRWPQDWPPMAEALLAAAESADAVLATVSNLYVYGPVDGPMTPDLPMAAPGPKAKVRAQMWRDALAAHESGRVRVTEVRGSDYLTTGRNSHLGDLVAGRIVRGRSARFVVPTRSPHTFTYVPDVAATIVAAAATETGWGRVWHVPSPPALTPRQAVVDLCDVAGVGPVRVEEVPWWLLRAAGLAIPLLRELAETRYQFSAPYLLDSSATVEELGVTATPWCQALTAVIQGYRTGNPSADRRWKPHHSAARESGAVARRVEHS